MPRDGLTTFGDLIGELEQIAFNCPKCGQLGRYSVRWLALAHGLHHLLAQWLDDMARDCSCKVSPLAADGCALHCPEPAQDVPEPRNGPPTRYANDDRHSHVLRRAAELARSGKYSGWVAIEAQLRFVEGYPEARRWLDDEYLRMELDRLCSAARNG
jgi:hypothetical protein